MSRIPKLIKAQSVAADFRYPIKKLHYDLEGHEVIYDVIEHPGAAIILPLTEDNCILAIKQFRYAIGKFIYELPAGTLDKEEAPLTCAEREIKEETGFGARKFTFLGEIYPGPGLIREVQYIYLAEDLYPEKAAADEDEVMETVKISIPDFKNMIKTSEVTDAKTIAAFYRFILIKGL